MIDYQLGVVESRFADIIWENEPISSTALTKLCAQELKWKKSTTYTVLKRLCEKGIFKNSSGEVTSVIKKADFYALQSEKFIETNFKGSLPAFLAAFSSRKTFTQEEIKALRQMVDSFKEG